jgi:hypothetical protein
MKKIPNLILSSLVVLFFAAGIHQFTRFTEMRRMKNIEEALSRGIRQGDRIADPAEAVKHYERLSPMLPEIALRIIQREWETVPVIRSRIENRRSTGGSVKSGQDFEFLTRRLDRMQERCDRLIEKDDIPENIRWQAYNLRGAIHLVAAYAALESSQNEKKAAAIIKAALADFKFAVQSADKAAAAGWERNIPCWNLELLFTLTRIRKIGLSTSDAQQRLNLKKNLEALIPEKAGYSAGAPPDRRIEK